MGSSAKSPITGLDTHELLPDTKLLRDALRKFLRTKLSETGRLTIGGCKFGVYAFFDYDGEPIYVGQTAESVSGRIGRHLTNQRTDAVAMSVLDPFEVHTIRVWPLPEFQGRAAKDRDVKAHLDALEATVYRLVVADSKFGAVLNEKIPSVAQTEKIPASYRCEIVSQEVLELRGHPDLRLARRAATVARLAQVICEREVSPGLRRTLLVQTRRLLWLAEQRLLPFAPAVADEDAKDESEEDREGQASDSGTGEG